ncbi:MAG: type B 50S ribosomal protein L31 [Verrucomicrobiota bacterium]|nr:type B 50S ribosomal protein L31 [Verrucomicrobiota bacterium]
MKPKIHPSYQEVLFVDSSTGATFLIGTTLQTKEKTTFEGKEYPMCRVPISSSSHPFFTKSKQFVDAEGRVDKFAKKYQRKAEEAKQAQDKQEEKQKQQKAKEKKKK